MEWCKADLRLSYRKALGTADDNGKAVNFSGSFASYDTQGDHVVVFQAFSLSSKQQLKESPRRTGNPLAPRDPNARLSTPPVAGKLNDSPNSAHQRSIPRSLASRSSLREDASTDRKHRSSPSPPSKASATAEDASMARPPIIPSHIASPGASYMVSRSQVDGRLLGENFELLLSAGVHPLTATTQKAGHANTGL